MYHERTPVKFKKKKEKRIILNRDTTMLGAGHFGVRIPADARNFSLLQNIQTGSGTHSAFY
jgi:hypothetical protein